MQQRETVRRPHSNWAVAGLLILLLAVALTACETVGLNAGDAHGPAAEDFSGFTKVATSEHYIVVVNVLPAEEMFTAAQDQRLHPTVGELVVDGRPTPRPPTSRHTEAHIYSKVSGLPVTDVKPRLTLNDHTSGRVHDIDATLMQDVVIGAPDLHFGSNVVIPPDHEFTIIVTIGAEEVSVDGLVR